ncbi:MAG: glycosyltransferase [Planctomycetes bacterium]|nr:glycosyltransferase [Planctomycetota bacterium]
MSLTVVTPSLNQAPYLRQCLDSVLDQGHEGVQHLVIDGGSTDGTVEILESYGDAITWLSRPGLGQSASLNEGFRRADGEIIGWLNTDDYYLPGAFDHALACLDAHPDAGMIYGRGTIADEDGTPLRPYPTFELTIDDFRRMCHVCQPSVFLRRRVLDSVGLLNERLDLCMDYEWWLRIMQQAPAVFYDQTTAVLRCYGDTKTRRRRLRALVEGGHIMHAYFGKAGWRWSAKWVVHRWSMDKTRFVFPIVGWVSALRCARRYRRRFTRGPWRWNGHATIPGASAAASRPLASRSSARGSVSDVPAAP